MNVGQILDRKGRDVWTIAPEATILEALKLMAEKEIGAVLVADDSGPVGIFSERDYARRVVLENRSSRSNTVGEVMTADPVCIRPDQSAEECMVLMTGRRIRHLPVIEDSRLVGLISIGDVVKSVISDQEYAIRQLENYIAGR